jgi:hypothetical protein
MRLHACITLVDLVHVPTSLVITVVAITLWVNYIVDDHEVINIIKYKATIRI